MFAYPPQGFSATSIPTSNSKLMLALERLTAVNDLSKYNIIRYIYNHPDCYGDAAYFARVLGFHSFEHTQAALESLHNAGVLTRSGPLYGRANNVAIWQAIAEVCNLSPSTPEYRMLVQRLANRSAYKAK